MKNILTLTPWLTINSSPGIWVSRFKFSVVILATVLALAGCGPEVWKWSEEAQLEGGKKIIVEREVIFGGSRLPWERDRLQSEYILRFASPDTPKTKFEYRSMGGLQPGALVFVNGTPYVLGMVMRGDAEMYYECPDPWFIVHRHDNGRWKRRELNELPPSVKKLNLAMFSREAMANAKAGQMATTEQVAEWNRNLGKRIVGKYSGTNKDEIPRPDDGVVIYRCPLDGAKSSDEWKADFRAHRVPSITE